MTRSHLPPIIRQVLNAGIEALGSKSSIVNNSKNYAVRFDAINIVFNDDGSIAVHFIHRETVVHEIHCSKEYVNAGNTFSLRNISGKYELCIDI